MIGRPVRDFLFAPGEDPIGQWIDRRRRAVPGRRRVQRSDGGEEEERQIYIPVSTAQLAFNGADHLGMLEFTVGDANAARGQGDHRQEIVGQLAERHQFDPTDPQAVRVHNNVEQFERFAKLFWMISIVRRA